MKKKWRKVPPHELIGAKLGALPITPGAWSTIAPSHMQTLIDLGTLIGVQEELLQRAQAVARLQIPEQLRAASTKSRDDLVAAEKWAKALEELTTQVESFEQLSDMMQKGE